MDKENKSEIIYLSKDTLVLSSLLEFDTIQIYERCGSLRDYDRKWYRKK
jgi:hypothetical protein